MVWDRVMGQRGSGSADWWVKWVTGHKIWPIVGSDVTRLRMFNILRWYFSLRISLSYRHILVSGERVTCGAFSARYIVCTSAYTNECRYYTLFTDRVLFHHPRSLYTYAYIVQCGLMQTLLIGFRLYIYVVICVVSYVIIHVVIFCYRRSQLTSQTQFARNWFYLHAQRLQYFM